MKTIWSKVSLTHGLIFSWLLLEFLCRNEMAINVGIRSGHQSAWSKTHGSIFHWHRFNRLDPPPAGDITSSRRQCQYCPGIVTYKLITAHIALSTHCIILCLLLSLDDTQLFDHISNCKMNLQGPILLICKVEFHVALLCEVITYLEQDALYIYMDLCSFDKALFITMWIIERKRSLGYSSQCLF